MLNRNILLTGGSGQLGTELQKLREYIAPSHTEMDITNEESVKKYLSNLSLDIIVHTAAYTKTLKPENNEIEAYQCYLTNVIGTRNIVKYAPCPVIYISTETALDAYNFYVLTKMQGEIEVMRSKPYQILRTSFRCNPFEYDKAAVDMLTIGDSVDKIARVINHAIDLPINNEIIYVGTGVHTVYDIAIKTRADVKPMLRKDIYEWLPSMKELLGVDVFTS